MRRQTRSAAKSKATKPINAPLTIQPSRPKVTKAPRPAKSRPTNNKRAASTPPPPRRRPRNLRIRESSEEVSGDAEPEAFSLDSGESSPLLGEQIDYNPSQEDRQIKIKNNRYASYLNFYVSLLVGLASIVFKG